MQTQYGLDAKSGNPFPAQWDDFFGTGVFLQVMLNPKDLPSGVTPVTGAITATGLTAHFSPLPGRSFNVSLWGTFSATLQLQCSFDGGTTWINVGSALSAGKIVVTEPEAGVLYAIDCTAFTSGTANFRMSQ